MHKHLCLLAFLYGTFVANNCKKINSGVMYMKVQRDAAATERMQAKAQHTSIISNFVHNFLQNKPSYTLPLLAYLSSCILFATSPVSIKTALNYYSPSVLLFWCMFLPMLTILPFALKSLKQFRIKSRKEAILLVLLLLSDPIAYFGFEILAIKYGSASQAGMTSATSPMIITLFAWIFLRERFSKMVWVGLAVTVVAVMVLTGGTDVSENASSPVLGTLFMILSKCGAGFFIIILRYFEGRFPLSMIVCIQFLVGSLFCFPAVITEPNFGLTLEAAPLLLLVYQGSIITLGGQVLSAYGCSYTPSHMIGMFSPLQPLAAVVFSMLLLGERLQPIQWAAFICIMLGMYVCQRYRNNM